MGRKTHEATDALRDLILRGELVAGTMLPPERELAETLGVSRLTLRSALASLATEGLIEKVHGAGNRVLDYRDHGGIELLSHLARIAMEGGEAPTPWLAQLLEFRRLVAVELLGLVSQRATSAELAALRKQLAILHEHGGEESFMREDLLFARILVRAAHNLTLELLYNTVQRLVLDNPGFEAAFAVNYKSTLRTYSALLDLLETRDPEKVRELARKTLEPLDRVTLDRLNDIAELSTSPVPQSTKGVVA